MSRISPELQNARQIIDSQQKVLASYRKRLDLADLPSCGDNSCVFGPRGGMATNGGCRCDEHALRSGAMVLVRELKRLRGEREGGR